MPVNFQTDLRDLKDHEYVPQLPLEAMFKNMAYKQAKYDQGFQQAQQLADALKVKAYGQDAVRRDKLVAEINQELEKFQGANFSDPAVVNQFTSYISSIASSPEFVGFAQRANWYDKAQAKLTKLTGDGTDIPTEDKMDLIKAEKYFAGEEDYNPNKRFTGDIYKPYDFSKFNEDVFKAITESVEKETGNKWITTEKSKQYENLYNGYTKALNMDSQALNALRRKFEVASADVDYNQLNLSELKQKELDAADAKANAEAAYVQAKRSNNQAEMEKARALYAQANEDLGYATTLMQSTSARDRKNLDWDRFLKKKAHDYSVTRMYYNTTEQTDNPYTMAAQNAQLSVATHALNNLVDAGSLGVDPTTLGRGPSGLKFTPVTDASGNTTEAVSAGKPVKITGPKGQQLDYAPTVVALQQGDPATMRSVFNIVKEDLFSDLKLVGDNPTLKNGKLVVEVFDTPEQKANYYDAIFKLKNSDGSNKQALENKKSRFAPREVPYTADELIKQIGIYSTKVGQGIQKATQQTPSNSTQNTTGNGYG